MLYVNPIEARSASQLSQATHGDDRESMALEEFEHLFLFQLLQEMRKTVPKSDLFGDGRAQRFYEEMMDDALSAAMADSGQLGMADAIEKQLQAGRMQHSLELNGQERTVAQTQAI